jgi:hypothetical protein
MTGGPRKRAKRGIAMALKSQANYLGSRFSRQGPGNLIDLSLKREVEPIAANTDASNGLSALDHAPLSLPPLTEMSEFNDYRVALVSQNGWSHRRGSAEPLLPAAPAVLLPISWRELLTKVCEFVRDSNVLAEYRVAQFADVCVDFIKMQVSRMSGEVITLTKQEFKTLKCFLSNPNRVFSRDELLNEAWGYENYPTTRTVDNHVLKLRKKLERDPERPVHFQTVHSVGYKFVT